MIDVSVIIPVYNVEKYLSQCLDSVCNQTLKNIEIICVNDGSTDNSLDILNEYASKDSRFKVINQNNQGLGASRNNGFQLATGEYVYFIDSDDYIELDALEKLYNNAISNNSDVVLFKFQKVDDSKNIHKRGIEFKIDKIFGDIDYNNFSFTYEDVKKHVMNSAYSACLKLYKKDFFDGIDFTFPEGLNFEDVPVHVRVMIEAERISFVNEFLYNYRSNPDSILNSTANGFDIFEVIDMVEEYLRKTNHYEELENEFIFFKIAQILIYIISIDSEDYFNKARAEFSSIEIKDEKTIKRKYLKKYELVLNSRSYDDFLERVNTKTVKNDKKSSNFYKKKIINLLKNIKD